MMSKDKYMLHKTETINRGRFAYFEYVTESNGTVWPGKLRYKDTDLPIEDDPRPCVSCGKEFPSSGIDPCLGKLPGVKNACCGHGIERLAYIKFKNKTEIRKQIYNLSLDSFDD